MAEESAKLLRIDKKRFLGYSISGKLTIFWKRGQDFNNQTYI